MSTIRFEYRKEKAEKSGLAPLRLVYQQHGQRLYYSTGEKLLGGNWDEKTQQAVYDKNLDLTAKEVKAINSRLADIKREIERIEERYRINEEPYTIEDVISELKAKRDGKQMVKKAATSKEVYAFIDNYIADHTTQRVKGSLSVYKAVKEHLEGFETDKGYKVTFENIDYSFFQKFQNYLIGLTKEVNGKEEPALNNITIAKQLSTLKTLLNYARQQGIEVSDKYKGFKISRDNPGEVIALTRKEFETLWNLDLSKRPAWDQVRDVFIFSCVTGLRYSDVFQLKREHIKEDLIDLTSIKTSNKAKIPLNPYSIAIIKKYKHLPTPLPVISNQRTNEHLQKICDWVGFNEPVEIVRKHGAKRIVNVYPKHELIRFHCGRKTFATLSIEAGMSAEYVMKIGGWKSYTSFKRYMNLTDESTKGAMAQAWGGKANKLKAV
ncbi:site-specific integrase [Flavihumibacter sediminis]|nr:site-specific integrase [Flavihumibacter sediminis]